MGRLAKKVREARCEAGITQVELAKRLGRSQTLVSLAEHGVVRIGRRYVAAVQRACAGATQADTPSAKERSAQEPHAPDSYIVGMDPETLQPVWRGSARDAELNARFSWWKKGYTGG
jgi:transcriptional regulator with XRE-family HTH domain